MASSIIWGGNTLVLPRTFGAWTPDLAEENVTRQSADGHKVTYHRHYLWRVHVVLQGPLPPQTEADLYTWWAWAMQGNHYGVALDSGKVLDTTLDGAANSGQKVVPLASTSGVAAGDLLLLTTADRGYFEVIVVDSVTAGVSVTATENLKQSFAANDTCRHFYYLPRAVAIDRNTPLQIDSEGTANVLVLDHAFEEDLA